MRETSLLLSSFGFVSYSPRVKFKTYEFKVTTFYTIISSLLGMNIILALPLNHPSVLLIYRYSILPVAAKFDVEV